MPLNPGEGYGLLRLITPSDTRPPSVRDVVIFQTLPNDLSHVGGVITEVPQTPLCHVNLKAKQNDTPNAYVKNASQDPKIKALLGKVVRYRVTPDAFFVEAATQAQADAFLEKVRPKDAQFPPRDLTVKEIRPLSALANKDLKSVGAKAANLAELRKILPSDEVPDGFGVPFSFYDDFMKANGLYDEAKKFIADPAFVADPAVREQRLDQFRRKIRNATVPTTVRNKLAAMQKLFPVGQAIRCRSSTNNEDLPGFNGAGLYDSYTHRPDEGHIENTVRRTWASLWNYRAFEERTFYRIDHLTTAMGVLCHPNQDDEAANGVAVTKNIYDPNWPGFYVNVQVGESLVTNPDPGATPDEFLIARLGPNGEYESQYVQHSSLLPAGKATILAKTHVETLTKRMEKIQAHFKTVYGAQNDPSFAMDIEFKITSAGKLQIKQARPWVD
jgi:phosphoenolpyruvate synthase/pyruvate phosphate dikinase